MAQVTVWQRVEDQTTRCVVSRPVCVSAEGLSVTRSPDASWAVVLAPVQPSASAIAVLLVSDAARSNASHAGPASRGSPARQPLTVNGLRVSAGMHLLRHADRVEVGDQTLWISGELEVEATGYDPLAHGDDVHCFLTKAPLSAAQLIKICPGTPGAPCGVIYKAEAWDLAMRPGNAIRCPNCGYQPDAAAWQPPPLQPKRNFDALRGLLPG